MSVLDEVQASIRQLAEGAGASVVGIGQRWGLGSGIVLGDGRVLTNAHNVRGDHVRVTFADGRTADGTVAGRDIDGDLAVIEVGTAGVAALPWADGAAAELGQPVFTLANPGGRGLRVTFGFVSGIERTFRGPRGRRITGSLEHTAPLLPGSSGGPVLNAAGQLLGINTNRLGEGFYLAIPADPALRGRADALARGESAAPPPRLGVALAPAHVARRLRRSVGLPEIDGLLIQGVEEESPAARAGLAQGDLIVAAAGQPVHGPDDLFDALQAAGQAGTIQFTVVRGTDERTIQVSFSG
ncbi:MAG TPA: S1C family serine protease [Streptosporangiaceae bacterium]|nr:S1C family serine protease [Streptosporangiaceae bacterium]